LVKEKLLLQEKNGAFLGKTGTYSTERLLFLPKVGSFPEHESKHPTAGYLLLASPLRLRYAGKI
jgi:hypothetical protein